LNFILTIFCIDVAAGNELEERLFSHLHMMYQVLDKTKNTISLCLWEAKASAGDFILFQFNDGQYESAAQLHSKAQQVCCL